MKSNNTSAMRSKILVKSLTVLEAFDHENPNWGIRDLARHLGMSPTIVHRIVRSFSDFGYLEQNLRTKLYSLGPRAASVNYFL